MKKKFLKLFLLIVSFFVFEISIEAADYEGILKLEKKEGNAESFSCTYKYIDRDSKLKLDITKDEKQFFYKSYNGKQVSFNAYETFKDGCPKYIEFKLYKSDVKLSTGTIVDMVEISISDYKDNKVSCGNINKIPQKIPELTSFAITLIQVAVPVILVIMGSIDFFKSITSGKEDEMKKGQKMFVKRLIVGIVIFLVVVLVKFFISIVADANVSNMVDCIDCFISNDCRR